MAKKVYFPVANNNQNYRLYMEDIKKIYKMKSKTRPPIPSYDQEEIAKKWEETTEL